MAHQFIPYNPLKPNKLKHVRQIHFFKQQKKWCSYVGLYQGRTLKLSEQSCFAFLQDMVQEYPSAPALTMDGQTLNFAELAFSIDALANWFLRDANTKSGDRVALYLPNCLSYMIAIFAAWRAQLIVANLSFLGDTSYILEQLQDSGAKILITMPEYLPQVENMLLQTSIRHIVTTQADDFESVFGQVKNWFSLNKWLEQWREDMTIVRNIPLRKILKTHKYTNTLEWPKIHSKAIAIIQYTSGTTGRPKGVALTHANLSANFQQTCHLFSEELVAGKCGLCPIPLQHIVGISFCLIMLCSGLHVVLTTAHELLRKPRNFLGYHFDLMAGIPYLYEQILKNEAASQIVKNSDLFLCGGSFVSQKIQAQWHKLTGKYLCEGYGMSETSPLISFNLPHRLRLNTAGFILPNTEVCVVNNNHEVLGFNQPGELWIKGPQVMRGYWHKPFLTQKYLSCDNWFRTGDIVTVSQDGFIQVIDRQCDSFWWKNWHILPSQIEDKISQHDDVLECVLMQDENIPIAPVRLIVVAKQGLTAEHLRGFIQTELQSRFMPDQIEFVDHLPRGPGGKVFRRLLRRESGVERSNLRSLLTVAELSELSELSE